MKEETEVNEEEIVIHSKEYWIAEYKRTILADKGLCESTKILLDIHNGIGNHPKLEKYVKDRNLDLSLSDVWTYEELSKYDEE